MGIKTDRGYTEHEHLDEVGIIHMNGRIYDPLIGRFMSADPTIPNPYSLKSFNRYSYVLNNPLSLLDPSGFNEDGPAGHGSEGTGYGGCGSDCGGIQQSNSDVQNASTGSPNQYVPSTTSANPPVAVVQAAPQQGVVGSTPSLNFQAGFSITLVNYLGVWSMPLGLPDKKLDGRIIGNGYSLSLAGSFPLGFSAPTFGLQFDRVTYFDGPGIYVAAGRVVAVNFSADPIPSGASTSTTRGYEIGYGAGPSNSGQGGVATSMGDNPLSISRAVTGAGAFAANTVTTSNNYMISVTDIARNYIGTTIQIGKQLGNELATAIDRLLH